MQIKNMIHGVREVLGLACLSAANRLLLCDVPVLGQSTQFGVECNGELKPTDWSPGVHASLPTVTGRTRLYESFKPIRVVADEQLIVTFHNAKLSDDHISVAVDVPNAGDLKLIGVFAGAKNCFPSAPDQTTGVSGESLAARSLSNYVDWPVIRGGCDLVISFAIRRTAVFRATPPTGYGCADITSIEVMTALSLFGRSVRK